MGRLCLLRGWTGQDSELNWVTLPVLGPKQDVGLEKLAAETRLPLGYSSQRAQSARSAGVLSSSKCCLLGNPVSSARLRLR